MPLKRHTRAGFTGSTRKIARYGWLPDLPDFRDFTYAAPMRRGADAEPIPNFVDLRSGCPPVYDQGTLGSCTANAIAAALEFDMKKQGEADFTPSRLFIYYNERAIEGTTQVDKGAFIRDGIKSVSSQGDCPETMWPYDPTQVCVQPTEVCYTAAVKYEALTYMSVDQNLADMKACLAEGFPFVYGFTVYESFESRDVAQGPNAGWVPMPGSSEKIVGGHAVLAVGYDDTNQVFICRNSWGPGWGDAGYFYMPYAYLLDDNLSDDFWTIRLVS